MANKDIAARSSGAHHQVDDRQRPEDVVVEPEEKDGRIFLLSNTERTMMTTSCTQTGLDFERILQCKNSS